MTIFVCGSFPETTKSRGNKVTILNCRAGAVRGGADNASIWRKIKGLHRHGVSRRPLKYRLNVQRVLEVGALVLVQDVIDTSIII